MRKRLYEIISASNGNDKLSSVYDIFMMAVIIVSLIPLVFKQSFVAFEIIDKGSRAKRKSCGGASADLITAKNTAINHRP